MPVLTTSAGSELLSRPNGRLQGDHPITSRLPLFIPAAAALLTILLLVQRSVLVPWLAKRYFWRDIRPGFWARRGSTSWTNASSSTDSIWMQPGPGRGHGHGQGQGSFEKQAKHTIVSRGESGGSAPAGLGGSGEGRSYMYSRMEEKQDGTTTTPSRERSRGVSTDSTYFGVSSSAKESNARPGLSCHDPLFPTAADESDHVRISPSESVPPSTSPYRNVGGALKASAERGEDSDSMDHDRLWGYPGPGAGAGPVAAITQNYTHLFGHGITDDERVSYGVGGDTRSVEKMGRASSSQGRLHLNFTRPSPPAPLTHPTLATKPARYTGPHWHTVFEAGRSHNTQNAYSESAPSERDALSASSSGGWMDTQDSDVNWDYYINATSSSFTSRGPEDADGGGPTSNIHPPSASTSRRRSYTRNIPIPSVGSTGAHVSQADVQPFDGDRAPCVSSGGCFSPSSYPSTSPLLPPPPPPTSDGYGHLDPAEIMFPGAGAVLDGGFRLVPAHDHSNGEGGITHHDSDVHGEIISSSDASCAGWNRHTRVYGGGVCVACAAAGGGGFYGARVRPEDKR